MTRGGMRELSDARLSELLADGPEALPPGVWDALIAERDRRGRLQPRLRVAHTAWPDSAARSHVARPEFRYLGLAVVVSLMKLAAVLVFSLSLLIGMAGFSEQVLSPTLRLAVVGLGMLAGLGLWGNAEVMRVLIAIEVNTRRHRSTVDDQQ